MSKLDTRAELIKLSRLMMVDEAELSFLEDVPLKALVNIRTLTTERIFSDGRKLFQNLAAASKLLPNGVTAMIAEKAMGPLLCARVAGEMPTSRAVDLAQRMSPPFLAEVTKAIDPKRVEDIIRNLPVSNLKAVALELIRQQEFLVMGGFVNFMPDAPLKALIGEISEKDLLHIGFFMEGKHQISEIIRLLPEDRLRKLVTVMQGQSELWPEALALMMHAEDDLKRQMGDIAVEQGQEMLDALTETVFRLDLWKDALPLFTCMSPGTQFQIINVPVMSRADVLEAVAINTDIYNLWHTLLPLMEYMTPHQRQTLGTVVTNRGDRFLDTVFHAAQAGGMWLPLLDVFRCMTPEARQASLPALHRHMDRDPATGARIRELAAENGMAEML